MVYDLYCIVYWYDIDVQMSVEEWEVQRSNGNQALADQDVSLDANP